MGEEASALPERETGWRGPLFAALLLLVVPATPLLRLVVPIEQTAVLLVPALAACAMAGWRVGGRLPLAVIWAALAIWLLTQPVGSAGTFALLARGWAVILAATFGAVMLRGRETSFLTLGLTAVGISLVLGALVVVVSGGVAQAYDVFVAEVARRSEFSQAQWRELTGSPGWLDLVRRNPDAVTLATGVEQQMAMWPGVGRLIFPSLLALESLAALALAWAFYHRVGRARLGPPLARLRDVRFSDALIWGVVLGLVLVVMPFAGLSRAIGINLLVFFGALYAIRGLGVLLWFLAPGRWMLVALTIFSLLFWYVVGTVAVGVGLGDTWFDWRRRMRPKSQRSE